MTVLDSLVSDSSVCTSSRSCDGPRANEGRKTGAFASNREGVREGGVFVKGGETERCRDTKVRGVWGVDDPVLDDLGVPGSPASPESNVAVSLESQATTSART